MKQLQKSDLQIGDILIFEDNDFEIEKLMDKISEGYNKDGFNGLKEAALDYLLHYLIAWFDPGKDGKDYKNIYHAGIWAHADINLRKYGAPSLVQDCVIQAGHSGISSATLEDMLAHEQVKNIYVCRLKNQDANFHEAINKSILNFYDEQGEYSYQTAFLLAAICSMRYNEGTIHKLIVEYCKSNFVADLIIERILNYINEYNDRHQREMIACSPLVAMMYKNAGYELAVNVFESIEQKQTPTPKFDVKALDKELSKLTTTAKATANWPAIKETVVTPRQLMESPDVELIGFLPHSN